MGRLNTVEGRLYGTGDGDVGAVDVGKPRFYPDCLGFDLLHHEPQVSLDLMHIETMSK